MSDAEAKRRRGSTVVDAATSIRALASLAMAAALAAACGDTVGATEASATSGGGSASESETASGTGQGQVPAPEPRWVLRDADGVKIQAFVEPRCGERSNGPPPRDCLPVDFGEGGWRQCVRVIDHEGRYINLLYDLATGTILPCMYDKTHGDITIPWTETPGATFDVPTCDGKNLYFEGAGPSFSKARWLVFAEGEMWYPEEEGCGVRDFWYLGVGFVCMGPYKTYLCPLKIVPDWVQNLLPNPPYTLDVEYQ